MVLEVTNMKELRFIFKSDDEIVIDSKSEYDFLDDLYTFSLFDVSYRFSFKEGMEFIRETKEEIFKLKSFGEKKEASVRLKDERVDFFINVNSLEYEIADKKYTIKYNIESTDDSYKTIEIEIL